MCTLSLNQSNEDLLTNMLHIWYHIEWEFINKYPLSWVNLYLYNRSYMQKWKSNIFSKLYCANMEKSRCSNKFYANVSLWYYRFSFKLYPGDRELSFIAFWEFVKILYNEQTKYFLRTHFGKRKHDCFAFMRTGLGHFILYLDWSLNLFSYINKV